MFVDIKDRGYSCREAAFSLVANNMGFGYEMIMLGKYAFEFVVNDIDESIGSSIYPYCQRNVSGLKLFHGLRYKMIENGPQNPDAIRKLLDIKIPVLVSLDLFDCPWCASYQKHHFGHWCVVDKYDKSMRNGVCHDIYIGKKDIEVDLLDLMNHAKSCGILELYENDTAKISYRDQLYKDVEFYIDNDSIAKMNALLKYFTDRFDLDNELRGAQDNYYIIPISDKIKVISERRKAYAYMLEYVADNQKWDLCAVINKMTQISTLWYRMYLIIVKLCVSRRQSEVKSVVSVLQDIIDLEEELANELLFLLKRVRDKP